MSELIDKVFMAKENYPFGAEPNEEFSLDAHKGERLCVIEVNEKDDLYFVLNLNLGSPEAWFTVNTADLKRLGGI